LPYYDKHIVPAKYSAVKVVFKESMTQYEHRNGHIELVKNLSVYKEVRTKAADFHYVMREVKCHH